MIHFKQRCASTAAFKKVKVMKKLIIILLLLITNQSYGQGGWFKTLPGWQAQNTHVNNDTLITLGSGHRWDSTFRNNRWVYFALFRTKINYSDVYTGDLYFTDTLDQYEIFRDSFAKFELRTPWLSHFDIETKNLTIGLGYVDTLPESKEFYKWQAGIFNAFPLKKLPYNLNHDTFYTRIMFYQKVGLHYYSIVYWEKPVTNGTGLQPTHKLFRLNNDSTVALLRHQDNPICFTCRQFYLEKLYADNQNPQYLYLQKKIAWHFNEAPESYVAELEKIDTNGNTVWKCNPEYRDSMNVTDFQMIQKPDGNILCCWSDLSRWTWQPGWWSPREELNPMGTVWFAEIDHKTGEVLWRKNIRQFLEWRMMPKATTDPDLVNKQDLYFRDVKLSPDGNIVWGGFRYLNYPKEENPWKFFPILLKTDLDANPIWYREFDLFPEDNFDKGMKAYSIEITPDNGFLLTGEYENRFSSFWQSAAILKLDSYGCLEPGFHATDNVVKINNPSNLCLVYPNPARNEFFIQYPADFTSEIKVQLTDMQGRVVFHSPNQVNTINTENLPSGIYFLQIQTLNNYHHETHKIIISR